MVNPKEEASALESKPTIVTAIESNRIVAHSYLDTAWVDTAYELGEKAKKLAKEWEALKVELRNKAKAVLSSIAKTNLFSKVVLFHGSNAHYIEVLASTKKKEVTKDLVDECAFHSVNVLTEEKEVTLTGPLAQWAVANLRQYASVKTLEDHMHIKRRWVLGDNFVEEYEASTDMLPLFERLKDAGYNAPSVECKEKK